MAKKKAKLKGPPQLSREQIERRGRAKDARAAAAKLGKTHNSSSWPFNDLPKKTRINFTSGGLPTLNKRRH